MATYLTLVAKDILPKLSANSIFRAWSQELCKKMLAFAEMIKNGIYRHGVVKRGGLPVFAYEVDGRGNYRSYDDSNLPSLLSLPYLGFVGINDTVYQNTRKLILSESNKYFYARG